MIHIETEMRCLPLLLAFLLQSTCAFRTQPSIARTSAATTTDPGPPLDTTVCELLEEPSLFDGKVVRLRAYWTRGFEESSLSDPMCPEEALVNWRFSREKLSSIWAVLGDESSTLDYYRKQYNVRPVVPFVKDQKSQEFTRLLEERIRGGQMAAGTLVGTFYAGRVARIGDQKAVRGFGHMGCCNLLIVSRVEVVQQDYSPLLNYSRGDWNIGLGAGCTCAGFVGLPDNSVLRDWQNETTRGESLWRLSPSDVALDLVKALKSGTFGAHRGRVQLLRPGSFDYPRHDTRPTEQLIEVNSRPYLKRYEWLEHNRQEKYVIVVARPYWLESSAGSAEKVIWAPVGASHLICPAPKK